MSKKPANPWDLHPANSSRPWEGISNPWGNGTLEQALPWDEQSELPLEIPETALEAFNKDLVNYVAEWIVPFHEDPTGNEKMLPEARAFVSDKVRALLPDADLAEKWERYWFDKLPGLLSSTAMRMSIDMLSNLLKALNLPYKVSEEDVRDFGVFDKKYSLVPETRSPEWISGLEVMNKWNLSPTEFAQRCFSVLPIFLWSQDLRDFEFIGRRVISHDDILYYQRTSKEFLKWRVRPNLWLCTPQWWYFRKSDVEFFEKLQELTTGKSKWQSCDEVADRWDASLAMIQSAIAKKKHPLKAYRLDSEAGLEIVTERFLRDNTQIDPLTRCLFQLQDVKDFEKKMLNKRFLGLSSRGDNKRLVIQRARSLKEKNPHLNKTQIISIIYDEGLVDVTEESIKRYLKNEHYAPRGRPKNS